MFKRNKAPAVCSDTGRRGLGFCSHEGDGMRREKMKKKKSIWKRIVLGVLLVIKMKFKQGKRKTFNRIRQVAKWIANIRFDSYPRVICKKRLAEKQEV